MMGASVLIVGLQQHDSGKTTFATALLRYLSGEGVDAEYLKPVSAFNVWRDYDALKESVRVGFPVSGDVLKVAESVGISERLEEVNPVCVVMSPVDPEKVGWSGMAMVSLNTQIVAVRVTERSGKIVLYEVERGWNRFPDFLSKEWGDFSGVDEVREVGYEEFEEIMSRARAHCDFWVGRVARRHEVSVVESSSNVSAPSCRSLSVDVVVAVTPGRVFVVDGERYSRAVEVAGYVSDPWKVPALEVLELARPEKSFPTSPGKIGEDALRAVADYLL
ncbi:putative P-loop ATPase/GTPase [Geoglobus ahangari]|uniref:Putative P-loop ATPase/GTPase n=2 Tax=Geoglobus ahangari TaxID=113653 RepID=A0A0F7IFA4_9EURY|nr:putative P-loop ATPase/GTPase [Geoglobus ahangari]